ncbi:MAG: hypothetical protein J0L70_23735 [Leptolyngbya sp. UWPOB_LEPTO1]|uniref:hypothetical protein n=1 Tax=Leptolyngbya sp. UWPOB_LEPTO1 TaxID=2815653 RepID=UPI001AC88EF2|nr:hypothetical protein [Leptolyngbya sp. UWPOB_LEPTO1]MBN8563555.1 hypothetical protein [Leptolyngbya sp. UWPOB_LEPTO1]
MAQRKNSVVLSETAISKLQVLVSTGEFCSLDDAASHIITSVLGSTGKYSSLSTQFAPKTEPKVDSTAQYKQDSSKKPEKAIETTVLSETKPNLAQSFRNI